MYAGCYCRRCCQDCSAAAPAGHRGLQSTAKASVSPCCQSCVCSLDPPAPSTQTQQPGQKGHIVCQCACSTLLLPARARW